MFPRFRYPSGDPPLGLCYIATAAIGQGHDVQIVDATWHPSEGWIERQLAGSDLVGVYVNTLALAEANRIIDWCMGQGIRTVGGGPHATVRPADVHGSSWRGEGEPLFGRSGLDNLDDYGHPSLHLVDMGRYTKAWHYLDHLSPRLTGANIVASRGCPFDCTYCQPTLRQLFGKKVRYHSPVWVSQEVNRLQDTYKVDGVFFHDDTFTARRDWVFEVCERLQPLNILWGCNARADTLDIEICAKMWQAGCRNVHLGIECASDRVRNEVYRKRISTKQIQEAIHACQLAGIAVMGFFMLGAPTETKEEMEETIELACELPLTEATFSITSPLPGSHLGDSGVAGWGGRDYYGTDATPALRGLQRKALIKFYLRHAGYIARHLTSWRGLERLVRKIGRFR